MICLEFVEFIKLVLNIICMNLFLFLYLPRLGEPELYMSLDLARREDLTPQHQPVLVASSQ